MDSTPAESNVIVLDDSNEEVANDTNNELTGQSYAASESSDKENIPMDVDASDSENIHNVETIDLNNSLTSYETGLEMEDELVCPDDVSNIIIVDTRTEQIDDDNGIAENVTLENDSVETTEPEAGACEELCIIPDTDRIITQAEKEAASFVAPVRDATDVDANPSSEPVQQTKDPSSEQYMVLSCVDQTINRCEQCCLHRKSKHKVLHGNEILYICDNSCLQIYKETLGDKLSSLQSVQETQSNASAPEKVPFSRKCSECTAPIIPDDLSVLAWETLEFCTDLCLAKYQNNIGSNCSKCKTLVQDNCMGKYCVRFGYNIRQFCSSTCLEQYKKGLKVCSYCQKEMSEEGFLAPVTDKSIFKDFCTEECLGKYKALSNISEKPALRGACSVCLKDKPIMEFEHDEKRDLFCGEPCFVAFKFVHNISAGKCDMCHKCFDETSETEYTMYYENAIRTFCSKGCQNVYIIATRRIVSCSWCKVKKYNFDMIKRHKYFGATVLICSLNCLNHQLLSLNEVSTEWVNCEHCHKMKRPLYYLSMSDSSIRNFCSYSCVLGFQNAFTNQPILLNEQPDLSPPIPVSGPKRIISLNVRRANPEYPTMPIITNVQSLANINGPSSTYNRERTKHNGVVAHHVNPVPQTIFKTQIRQQVIIKPPVPVSQRNIATMCKVTMFTKGTSCRVIITANKAVQTDEIKKKIIIIPIPVPIYVPLPMQMYSQPFPTPFPFPVPIPVPIFIPTTRNSTKGIMKEIKKIQTKIPSDPLEAELLMMAEMVAEDKKDDPTDSESDGEEPAEVLPVEEPHTATPEPPETNSSFGEEVLEMAITMAAELDEPAVDLEGALTVNTVTASVKIENSTVPEEVVSEEPPQEERKPIRSRGSRGSRGSKRQTRRSVSQQDASLLDCDQSEPAAQEPLEKPDANMCLKFTFGVNAWKQWVTTKNTELEQTSSRAKLFKPEILQLTSDELNYSLCLFVKEVRKPNGQEYAPDTIYYLCLGIQQYLLESQRIDNIFCDSYYEKFTDCLDEVARKFSVLYNDSHYIITRVEEEHLWESKQLGAHSPHVLLSTLMFFNTKHFNLTSVEDHMKLSFSHIMKHWKRNTSSGSQKSSGSRNVLLRFYPPQSTTDGATRKKKVYEQQENEDNPLRCPVKLYEFYLSKCPESVKTRNDVFYLLPERSCVPDSPVWYSTMALPRDALEKMLHRVKMVKEINVALLTS